MSIKSIITSPSNSGFQAEVIKAEQAHAGAVVYSHDYHYYHNFSLPLSNSTLGDNLAIDASSGGDSDEYIHDGNDNIYWTGTGVNFNFSSTDQTYTVLDSDGTQSIDGTASVDGSEARFVSPAPILFSTYVSVSGAIYLTSWDTKGTLKDIEIELWLSGVLVSSTLNLSSYINTASLNTWQTFTIPFTDLFISGTEIDELVIRTRDVGAGPPPDYYLDALRLEKLGAGLGTSVFETTIPKEQTFLVHSIEFVCVDDFSTTLADNSTLALSYDKFFGRPILVNGMTLQIKTISQTLTYVIRSNYDFFRIPGMTFAGAFSDGTNSVLKFKYLHYYPTVLKSEEDDFVKVTLNDNLSDLIFFNVLVDGAIETDRNHVLDLRAI